MSKDLTYNYYRAAWLGQHIFIEHLRGTPRRAFLLALNTPPKDEAEAKDYLHKVLYDIWNHYTYWKQGDADIPEANAETNVIASIRAEVFRRTQYLQSPGWNKSPDSVIDDLIQNIGNGSMEICDPTGGAHQAWQLVLATWHVVTDH